MFEHSEAGAVILLSGGADSTVCLAAAIEEFGKEKVVALSFKYGQKHSNEIVNAQNVAEYYGVEHVIATIDNQIFAGSNSTLLTTGGEIERKSYAEVLNDPAKEGVVDTYVPFRNGLMLAQAAAVAYSRNIHYIYYGAHADDAAGGAYPDCTPAFYGAMNEAIYTGTQQAVEISAPLLYVNKTKVVELGIGLEVPFELTRSCYDGHEHACGTCGTCRDRINAFKTLGYIDPVPYEEDIDWKECIPYTVEGQA